MIALLHSRPSPLSRTASRLGLALVLGLSACSNSGAKIDEEAQLEMYRETALGHYEAEDLVASEEQTIKALGIDGEDYQMRLLFAWINLRKGTTADLKRAEGVFVSLLKDMPKEGDYRVELGLGQTRERLGVVYDEAARAIEAGQRYTDRDPAKVTAQLHEDALEAWTDAESRYLRVLELMPGTLKALNGLQRVTALLGRPDESLQWSEKLLAVTQESIRLRDQQLQFGDLNRAREGVLRDQQLKTRELEVATLLYSADVNMGLGRDFDALANLDRALALDGEIPEAYARKAQILFRLKRYDGASTAIQEYLRTSALPYEHPDVRRAYDLLAECEAAALKPSGG